MTTSTHLGEPCPHCRDTSAVHVISGAPHSDVLRCDHCGGDWTITIDPPQPL